MVENKVATFSGHSITGVTYDFTISLQYCGNGNLTVANTVFRDSTTVIGYENVVMKITHKNFQSVPVIRTCVQCTVFYLVHFNL